MKPKAKDKLKTDSTKNGIFDLEQIKQNDAKKVSLRIDDKTVILVDKENQNEAYRQQYIGKLENRLPNY